MKVFSNVSLLKPELFLWLFGLLLIPVLVEEVILCVSL